MTEQYRISLQKKTAGNLFELKFKDLELAKAFIDTVLTADNADDIQIILNYEREYEERPF